MFGSASKLSIKKKIRLAKTSRVSVVTEKVRGVKESHSTQGDIKSCRERIAPKLLLEGIQGERKYKQKANKNYAKVPEWTHFPEVESSRAEPTRFAAGDWSRACFSGPRRPRCSQPLITVTVAN